MDNLMLAMEWGFRAGEKGYNLDRAKREFKKIIGEESGKN